jgi:hypothetical protein
MTAEQRALIETVLGLCALKLERIRIAEKEHFHLALERLRNSRDRMQSLHCFDMLGYTVNYCHWQEFDARNGKGAGTTAVVRDAQRVLPSSNPDPVCNSPPSSKQDRGALAVADGRDLRGTVEHRGRWYLARDAQGDLLGRFRTLREAVRAIPAGGAP